MSQMRGVFPSAPRAYFTSRRWAFSQLQKQLFQSRNIQQLPVVQDQALATGVCKGFSQRPVMS